VFVVLYYIITLYSRNKEVGKECPVMSLCNNFSKNDKTVYNEFTILPENMNFDFLFVRFLQLSICTNTCHTKSFFYISVIHSGKC